MMCKCGNHFCWLCADKYNGNPALQFISSNSSPIYAHLNEAHGDLFTMDDIIY
jgi:hypothetical protein